MKQPITKCLIWALGLALSMSLCFASNGRPIIEENQGKALLIYNIAKFTVWPSETPPSDAPFIFGLWGNEAIAKAFQVVEGQKVHGRTVRINRYSKGSLPVGCDLIIIPKHQLQEFIKAKDKLGNLPILTVTTDPAIFDAGAMMLVEVVDDHLSFSVNLGAVKASGLEISGNLLRLARKVNF
ncbi:MAG: YfiR family protein [Opitutaceae bacterium]